MSQINLHNIATEQRNPHTAHIDEVSTLAMMQLINAEDCLVAPAVGRVLPDIAAAVDLAAAQLGSGGRMFYVGAGTSGRLGVLDASECPPTYGTAPEMVQGLIAGGIPAMFKAQEGAEDDRELGAADLKARLLSKNDIVIALAASGRTPYVLGAASYAASIGVPTVGITCSPQAPLLAQVDIGIAPNVGPEVITGSTRMKAGTAQKLILNMLSTGIMIKLGKVYGNLMVDVQPTNDKLVERSRQIVVEATGASYEAACRCLKESGGNTKLAVFMLLADIPAERAAALLTEHNGHIAAALASLSKRPKEQTNE